MVHLTEKPVELAARAIQYSSRPGENVLDLFGGSGLDAHGLRADSAGTRSSWSSTPPTRDVIVERWETVTGRKAKRESTTPPARKARRKAKS